PGAEDDAHADDHRPCARDAGSLQGDRPPLALEHDGADHRRVRHRQGARRAGVARELAAGPRAFHRAQHVGDRGRAPRVGAVRSREGRIHRRDRAPHRAFRAGGRRHALPRRDRRYVARRADAPPPCARRERVLPRRRADADPRRRARDRRDAPEPRPGGRRRPLPRGPLPPPQRDAYRGAAAQASPRGYPRARALLPRARRGRARRRAEDAESAGHRRDDALRLARQRPRARERLPAADRDRRRARDRRAGPAGGGRRRGAPQVCSRPRAARAERARVARERAAAGLGVAPKPLSQPVIDVMMRYDWPGNARELVNVCRRLTVTAAGREIVVQDLPKELGGAELPAAADWTAELAQWAEGQLATGRPAKPLLDDALPAFERTLIIAALRSARGKRLEAAKLLGWGRNTLTRKIKELGLEGRV